ncbi:uncharacterized protein LOC143259618 isoform X2 [Megalopta genalis]
MTDRAYQEVCLKALRRLLTTYRLQNNRSQRRNRKSIQEVGMDFKVRNKITFLEHLTDAKNIQSTAVPRITDVTICLRCGKIQRSPHLESWKETGEL